MSKAYDRLFADRYYLGLDLGQCQDFTALVCLQRRWLTKDRRSARVRFEYQVRAARRWALRTPYSVIAQDVCALIEATPALAGCTLGVDATGVGMPVVELIKAARPNAVLRPVTITGGHNATPTPDGGWHVPKMLLVGVAIALIDSGRLKVPREVGEYGPVMKKEVQTFRGKLTASGKQTAEAEWRTRAHDDLVLALSIAAFLGENTREFWVHTDGFSSEKLEMSGGVKIVNDEMGKSVITTLPKPGFDPSPGAPGWYGPRRSFKGW
jgi:hypothetical protein